jgi:hypothetical protein
MASDRPARFLHRLATATRVSAAVGICAAGVLAAGAFTSSAPAAPQDCVPVLGVICVTTTMPTVSVPVTLPTLPTLPTTTTGTGPEDTTASSTTATGSTSTQGTTTTVTNEEAGPLNAVAFNPKATVRVRGRGSHRVVEIRVNLNKAARLNALLSRNHPIAKRLFAAKVGSHLFRLKIGRTAKPGLAKLSLAYRAATGEAVRRTYRLRLPR